MTNLRLQRAVSGARVHGGGVETGILERWLAAEKGDGDGVESAETVRDDSGVDCDG